MSLNGIALAREEIYVRSDGAEVPLVPEPYCKFCCKPVDDKSAGSSTCHDCAEKCEVLSPEPSEQVAGTTVITPYYFKRAGAVGLYVTDKSFLYHEIWELKRRRVGADLLAECMDHVLRKRFQEFLDADLVVPVPSGSGFLPSSSQLLAESLVLIHDEFRLRDVLRFTKGHVSQKKAETRDKRLANPLDTMRVRLGMRQKIQGKTVLLVDDTFVTGATANEAARTLVDHGATSVNAIVLGRAIWPNELEYIGYSGRL